MEVQEVYFIVVKDKEGTKHTLILDGVDFERVALYDWWVKKDINNGHIAVTNIGQGEFVSLQQFILGSPPVGTKVIFKDRNSLNFRRSNMKFYVDKLEQLKFRQKHGYTFED